MVRYLILLAGFLLLPSVGFAKERRDFVFDDGLTLSFELPSERWQVTRKAPEFLVKETVAHVRFHLEEGGREVPADLETSVSSRLGQNELYVYNPETAAHLDIDLSPLEFGQAPPSEQAVASSAEFAKAELSQEQDISDISAKSEVASLPGARSAFRIDASFNRDGAPRRFIGLIGYVPGYWFFFYYTEKNQSEDDKAEMEALLNSLNFSHTVN